MCYEVCVCDSQGNTAHVCTVGALAAVLGLTVDRIPVIAACLSPLKPGLDDNICLCTVDMNKLGATPAFDKPQYEADFLILLNRPMLPHRSKADASKKA